MVDLAVTLNGSFRRGEEKRREPNKPRLLVRAGHQRFSGRFVSRDRSMESAASFGSLQGCLAGRIETRLLVWDSVFFSLFL